MSSGRKGYPGRARSTGLRPVPLPQRGRRQTEPLRLLPLWGRGTTRSVVEGADRVHLIPKTELPIDAAPQSGSLFLMGRSRFDV